jgi:hypothetical protein
MDDQFQALKSQYFDGLCRRLGLTQAPTELGAMYSIVAAIGGNVRIYFEYDRGLCQFSIGPSVDSAPMCDVETLAERFPRVRVLSEGTQRLSLQEQSDLILGHWPAIQVLCSAENLPASRAWIGNIRADAMRKYSGGS